MTWSSRQSFQASTPSLVRIRYPPARHAPRRCPVFSRPFASACSVTSDNFTQIPNGLPGIETRLPILFTEGVSTGRITPQRFVQLTSSGPARIFGLDDRKGAVSPGFDADLIIVDPEREVTVEAANLHSAVDYSPYEGMRLRGFPTWTLSRGEIIVWEGRLSAPRGRGHLVERRPIEADQLP